VQNIDVDNAVWRKHPNLCGAGARSRTVDVPSSCGWAWAPVVTFVHTAIFLARKSAIHRSTNLPPPGDGDHVYDARCCDQSEQSIRVGAKNAGYFELAGDGLPIASTPVGPMGLPMQSLEIPA
jgi:hypothetical protein